MIILILVIGLILRLINLNQSLWLDEAINVVYSQKYNLWDFLTKYPFGDFHPPGYFFILWIWTRLFGVSEITVRIPSVIFGVAAIYLTFLIGKKLFDKKVGLTAAILLAVAPLHVYYSQEARMYSFATFAVTLSTYFLLRLEEKKLLIDLNYILSMVLIFYSDYVAYFIIPVHVFFIILTQKAFLKRYLVLFLSSSLFLAPWLLIFKEQIQSGINAANSLTGWKNVVGGTSLKDLGLIYTKIVLGRTSFDNKLIYLLFVLLSLLILLPVAYKSIRKINNQVILILSWIGVPVIISFLISLFIPILSYFRLLFILPAVYLLIAFGLSKFHRSLGIILTSIIIALSVFSLTRYYTDTKFQREDWKETTSFISNQKTPVILENDTVFAPLEYYLGNNAKKITYGLKKTPAGNENDLSPIPDEDEIYVLEYLVDVTDPKRLLEQRLKKVGFKRVNTYNFNGVGFIYLYQR